MTLDIEDHAALDGYLRRRGWVRADEPLGLRTLSGGVSNRTVLVQRVKGEDLVVKQALAKLRVQVDWFSDPARAHREGAAMRCLARLVPGAVPRLIDEDPQAHLIAMSAVPQPHENWKERLLRGQIEEPLVADFGRLLGRIHAGAAGEGASLASEFADQSWFLSLRVEPYYQFTAARVSEAASFLEELADSATRPAWTLVHGDYSPKNILIHAGRLVLLDHEVAHWGDGAFDLGFALAHLLSKAHHVTTQRSAFLAAAGLFWRSYLDVAAEAFDAHFEHRVVGHTLGCLLARAFGRSTLEYLDQRERSVQRRSVVALLADRPTSVPELCSAFVCQLGRGSSRVGPPSRSHRPGRS